MACFSKILTSLHNPHASSMSHNKSSLTIISRTTLIHAEDVSDGVILSLQGKSGGIHHLHIPLVGHPACTQHCNTLPHLKSHNQLRVSDNSRRGQLLSFSFASSKWFNYTLTEAPWKLMATHGQNNMRSVYVLLHAFGHNEALIAIGSIHLATRQSAVQTQLNLQSYCLCDTEIAQQLERWARIPSTIWERA